MRLVLDGKSLLVGVFAGAALVASLGAMQDGEAEVGRYGIVAAAVPREGGGAHRWVWAVDTATGDAWEVTKFKVQPAKPME